MAKRACVFVDGENFRHTITDLFKGTFSASQYLPRNANWTDLFDWFIKQALPGETQERVRTYWYTIRTIDCSPYALPEADKDPDKLRRILARWNYYKNNEFLVRDKSRMAMFSRWVQFEAKYATLEPKQQITELGEFREYFRTEEARMHARFRGWTYVHNNIASKHRCIEFRTAGAIHYNSFTGQFGREKAVDVRLASDLIVLRDIYDVAIIVSGDQDFVPAVQVIKDFGKHVVNVAFATGDGKLLPGGARRLNQATDWSLRINRTAFASRLKINISPISASGGPTTP